jgi:hypothetical protein
MSVAEVPLDATFGVAEPQAGSPVVGQSFAIGPHMHRTESGELGGCLQSALCDAKHRIYCDHANYYSWLNLRDVTFGVAASAPLANTSLDVDFQDWYQNDVRSPDSDNFTASWKVLGNGRIIIPTFVGLALVGGMMEDRPLVSALGEYGDRVTRGYLVGMPPMLLMQSFLGSSRPGEASVGSQWKPFDDCNAISGHAFVGAVPLITAAMMAENPWAKSGLYVCSGFTAWSRLNDNDHYLSQVALAWWMAYLACRAVDDTECGHQQIDFAPLVTRDVSGIALVFRR